MNTSRNFSRRNFLKSAAVAGVAPLILPSSLWSAATPPSEQITLGFIGMGTQNRGLLGGFMHQKGTRVLAVCDVDTTRRENAKKTVESFYAEKKDTTYKGCDAYPDFRELVARKDIDAVVIATPDHWHALIAVAAAEAGKDIYCEKPMAHTVHEGVAMVKAVRAKNRVFQVGSMQRSSREFRAACELVRNGALGKVAKAEFAVGGPGVPCNLPPETDEPGLNWDSWLGPAPKRPYNSILSPRGVHKNFPDWRNFREYGGGAVTDWGAHHLDIIHWGLGFDDSGPLEIIPAAAPNAQSGVKLLYAGGVEVNHIGGNGVTFYGDKGKLYVNRGQFKLWMGETQKASDVGECRQVLEELLPKNAQRLYSSDNHLQDFLACVRSRKRPICDVEVGSRTSAACNLVNLAYYHHQRMKWDPKKQQFAGGTGDPKWLTKEYRTPWKLA